MAREFKVNARELFVGIEGVDEQAVELLEQVRLTKIRSLLTVTLKNSLMQLTRKGSKGSQRLHVNLRFR